MGESVVVDFFIAFKSHIFSLLGFVKKKIFGKLKKMC